MTPGLVLWLTGIPGAGKTTVARAVADELRRRGGRVEVLDGDVLRAGVSSDLGFSPDDRLTQSRRAADLADAASRSGATVVVALVSPYRAGRDAARALLGERYLEVHVRASLEACMARDPKGLYARAQRGEIHGVTGLDAPYEEPDRPHLVLETELESATRSAERVVALWEAAGGADPAARIEIRANR